MVLAVADRCRGDGASPKPCSGSVAAVVAVAGVAQSLLWVLAAEGSEVQSMDAEGGERQTLIGTRGAYRSGEAAAIIGKLGFSSPQNYAPCVLYACPRAPKGMKHASQRPSPTVPAVADALVARSASGTRLTQAPEGRRTDAPQRSASGSGRQRRRARENRWGEMELGVPMWGGDEVGSMKCRA